MAQPAARFDLTGPKIDVRDTRAGVTLPIASVPNLQPGDRLWIHPDLPATQSVRYLLVVVFLRGTTNPPPLSWFVRIDTWEKKVREEGVEVPVPDGAEQAVMLLAPATGGDFGTLRSAVQGSPGVFVRASQDLNLAGFEQARIEKYIASMKEVPPTELSDAKDLQQHSTLIAGTLALKPNADCMKLPPDQQYTCFTQAGTQTLLDDGHGQTIVAALSNGPGSDFINQASYTQAAGAGVYSAYVGAIVDLIRIMGSLHTAQYRYIPAIAFPEQQALNLRLNTPPSFHNPKSVIVIGLPAVQATVPPPLRPVDPTALACLAKPGVVFPVEGAPLVFSTALAHDLILHINYPKERSAPSEPQDIPLTADAYKGGLVLAPVPQRHPLPTDKAVIPSTLITSPDPKAAGAVEKAVATPPSEPLADLTGTIRGAWGFDAFTGPTIPLEAVPGKDWKLEDTDPLVAGKDQHLLLDATATACLESVALQPESGATLPQTWKPTRPGTIDVSLNLSAVPALDPGSLHLVLRQFGDKDSTTLSLSSYSEPARISALDYHAEDTTATLLGSGLVQVAAVEFSGITFTPQQPRPGHDEAGLVLSLPAGGAAPSLVAGKRQTAQIKLKNGRTLPLAFTVGAVRPTVTLLSTADIPPVGSHRDPGLFLHLTDRTDLPLADTLMFSLKSNQPFPRTGKLQIATADGSLDTTLTVSGEALILQDPHTLLVRFEPLKTFGPSAYGPLRLRAVAPDGTPGDWLPLITLVRLPTLTGLSCPVAAPAQAASSDTSMPVQPQSCTLTGSALYLLDSLATDPAFTSPVAVPQGFVGSSITVPPPTGAVYYLRLRDDPAAIDTVTLPAGPL